MVPTAGGRPSHVKGCIEQLGLPGGHPLARLGAKDTVKNLADAEEDQ